MARWLEVTQSLVETQAKGRAGLLGAIHGAPVARLVAARSVPGRDGITQAFRSPTGVPMDAKVREEIETAVHALDEALGGLINFTMTLRPTLRNEIMQICGHHIEKARQARDRLEALLQDSGS
jgi:hypothetical protein